MRHTTLGRRGRITICHKGINLNPYGQVQIAKYCMIMEKIKGELMVEGIRVLDPTIEANSQNSLLAIRPESLNGLTVGLLANGKKNSVEILQYVYEILRDDHGLGTVIEDNKGNASRPCPPDLLEKLADQCDVIITASGD